MASAFRRSHPHIIDVDASADYHDGIRKGDRALRNRILIADVLKNAGMLEKFKSIVEYTVSADTPRDPSQQGCSTAVGFDIRASKFEDELMELARKDNNSASTETASARNAAQDARPPSSLTPEIPHQPKPRAGVQFVRDRVLPVSQPAYGRWCEDPSSGLPALVLEFTNEARKGVPSFGTTVKGSLIFSDDASERLRVGAACWINEQSDLCKFDIEDTHALLVGIVSPQKLTTMSKRRKYGDMGSEILQIEEHSLAGFKHGFVRVRLTDVNSGELLYEENFELSFNPLKIIPVTRTEGSVTAAATYASVTNEKAFEVELLGASRSIYTFDRGDSPYMDIGATVRIHNRKDNPTTVFVRRIAVKVANGIEKELERAVMIRPGPISSIEDMAGFNSYEVPGCSSLELTLSTRKWNPSDLGEYLENSSPEIVIELGETFGSSGKVVGPMKFGGVYKQ